MKNSIVFIFSSIPLLLISGPFLSGIAVVTIGLYGLYNLKSFSLVNDKINIKYILLIFLLFYLYLLFTSSISELPKESFKSSLFYCRFIFFSVGAFLLMKKYKNKIYQLMFIFITISFMVVFLSLIAEFFIEYFIMQNRGNGQLTGVFFKEKIAGSYISRLYPLLIGLAIIFKSKTFNISKNNFILILFIVSTSSVLLSGERASISIFLISNIILIIGLKMYRNLIFSKKSILSITFILVFFSIFANPIFERVVIKTIHQITENGEFNIISKHHESHLVTAYKMFSYNKITGVGPRMFRHLCDKGEYIDIYNTEIQYQNNGLPKYIDGKIQIKEYNGCSTHPHNMLFQILSETGLIGILFYLFFIFIIYKDLFQMLNKKDKSDSYIILLASLACLSASFFPLLPSNNFFGSYVNIFYYFILTFYLISKNEISQHNT